MSLPSSLARCAGVIAACLPLLAVAAPAVESQRLYQHHCAACHGEHGDGKSRAQFGLDPPPRDFTTAEAWQELSRERMILSVTYGRPGTAMVGWGDRLGEDGIAAVVDYIRASFMHPPAAPQPASGQPLYKRHCAACHGDRGNGATWARNSLNPPPRDFTAADAGRELTRERMLLAVTHGRPGTAMMPFSRELSAAEIETVVDYVRATFMTGTAGPAAPAPAATPAPTGPAADMSAALPHGLRGDADQGRRFYLGNCYVCHGEQGDGRGPRASFIQPPPRNFLAPESRRALNRPALFAAISGGKRGTVMPAWSSVLSDQEIADVAEFVFTAFIAPAPETQKKKAVN
ncbi:MAG: c-type cytochrome [Gammaproteobacteria bacterium]|nr:c-type cytochrome [Gammaproteobacteria bacterium]